MKPWHLLTIIILIISLTTISFSADYATCTCPGKCQGRDLEQSATKLLKDPSHIEKKQCIKGAKMAFGGHCGGLAGCDSGCVDVSAKFACGDAKYYTISDQGVPSDMLTQKINAGDKCLRADVYTVVVDPCGENCECDSDTRTCWPKTTNIGSPCCQNWCSGFSADDPPAYLNCIQSCEARCRLNELTQQIISVVQYLAVVIVAILLAVNGIRFITSTSPDDRDQAKHSIRYVLIALIILALLNYIIIAIFFPVQVPGGDTSIGECTSDVADITPLTLPPGAVVVNPVASGLTCTSAYYLRDLGGCKWHDGIDLAVADGTPMVAPVTGTVVRAGLVSGYGNTVAINIKDTDIIVFTAHMKSVDVSIWDETVAGVTPIGRSGDIGTPESYHIHLGVHTDYVGGIPNLDRCCGIDCGSCKGPCSRDPKEIFTDIGSCGQNSPCSTDLCLLA